MITFFCYCALEQTTGLWGSSYLVFTLGALTSETAAGFASLFSLESLQEGHSADFLNPKSSMTHR